MVSHLKALSMTIWYSAMPSTRASTALSSRLTSRAASLQSGLCSKSFSACNIQPMLNCHDKLQGREHITCWHGLCMRQMVTCRLTDPAASGSACAKDCTSMVCNCCSLRPWAVVAAAAMADDDACSHTCSHSSMYCSLRCEMPQHKTHGLLRAAAVAGTQAHGSFLL